MVSPISSQDREWRAQDDARTLASAKQIMMDAERHTAAQAAARAMVEKAAEEAKALKSVAGGSDPTRKASPSEESGGKPRPRRIVDSMASIPVVRFKRTA